MALSLHCLLLTSQPAILSVPCDYLSHLTVTFKLEQGSGPVSIAGIHERVLSDLLSEDELEDEEMEESIESPQAKSKITTKRPAQSVSLPVQKLPMKKTKVEQRSPTDSDDDDDEEDESDDEAEMKKGLSLFQNNGKDDDDDDDDDDDYEDEDDDDDDDSEEEMQESNKKEVTTMKQSPRKFQTPQQPKTKKGKSQSAKKAESTPSKRQPPAESKSASKAPKEMSLKEIKTKLQETPNLPKKREKFDNFMRNNFKINDKMTKDKLWEFAQKIKKT